ncbi:hypothetical protein [Gluconacetobacter diazotrophicus]|uniref:Entericidin EcnAB n=2 Tax=Gluconacetobacter diazotrophicus TaxID=33996 RepID=A0A7W4I5R7_GLUDI|nr:hypothetical protein [Gluconacetobacter diazotrophicus]MBB2156770.1 hypothetical protein [Gluconacetobacter diazotrophicus]
MKRIVLGAVLLAMVSGTLAACEQHRTFGQKVQDTLDPPKGPGERAGRSIDRATGN